jgi:hypothetical protein
MAQINHWTLVSLPQVWHRFFRQRDRHVRIVPKADEAAAKERGVSLNAELTDRVERSFAKDDAFGGLVIANMARLMAAAFLQGGQHATHALNHPDWRPARWIQSSFCYDAAVKAVGRVLKGTHPINLPRPGRLVDEWPSLRGEDALALDEDGEPISVGSETEQQPLAKQNEREPSDER